MAKLPKFTLDFNAKKRKWDLTNHATHRIVKSFDAKQDAAKGGVLKQVVGTGGGSVKIKTQDNKYQEERTYPRTGDPKKSPG